MFAQSELLASLRTKISSALSSVSYRPSPFALKVSGVAGAAILSLGVAASILSSKDSDADLNELDAASEELPDEPTLFPKGTIIAELPATLFPAGTRISKPIPGGFKKKASPGEKWDPESLFATPAILSASLAKLESLPLDAAFRAAVLTESGGRQFDSEGNVMRSHKDALGIAQILATTAANIAERCTGKPLDYKRLEMDETYNHDLGKCYYKIRYNEYNQSPILAALAYNMGTKHVRDLINRVGDPTKGQISMIDFIKKVPFDETRYYTLYMIKKSGILEQVQGANPYGTAVRSTVPSFSRAVEASPSVPVTPRLFSHTSASENISMAGQSAKNSPTI